MISLPVLAGPLHLSETIFGFDLGRALEELHTKTCGHMEGNMAVHKPSSRVVRLKGENNVASGREVGCVTADGVVGLETRDVAIPDRVLLLIKYIEVVAMKMNGMG